MLLLRRIHWIGNQPSAGRSSRVHDTEICYIYNTERASEGWHSRALTNSIHILQG